MFYIYVFVYLYLYIYTLYKIFSMTPKNFHQKKITDVCWQMNCFGFVKKMIRRNKVFIAVQSSHMYTQTASQSSNSRTVEPW